MQPYLADGTLSEKERRALRDYQEQLYGPDGRLKPEARPRFEKVGKDYGRVVADLS